MKRRLVISFLGVTTVVLVMLAVPMGYLLQRVARDESEAQLEQVAVYVLDQVDRSLRSDEGIDPTTLQVLVPDEYAATITLNEAQTYDIHERPAGDLISARVRGPNGRSVTVYASAEPVRDRVQRPLVILAGLGLAGLLATWLLAQAEARRLGQPLRDLAATAARLGSGDFSVTAPRSGIPELDSLATTLDASAARIDALVRAERSFNSDAGHQLRSALTGLRLRLEEVVTTGDEAVAVEAQAAIEQADRLSTTIDDLLRLSRTGRAGVTTRFDLRTLVANHISDIELVLRHQRRRVTVVPFPELVVEAAQGAVGQALDVLLWNASKHGRGTITVSVLVADGWAELNVADDGRLDADRLGELFVQRPRSDHHGIGLPLARRIIEAEGGRLEVAEVYPTTFRIRLPLPDGDWAGHDHAPEQAGSGRSWGRWRARRARAAADG